MMIRSSTKNSRYLDDDGKNVMAWPTTVAMQPTIVLLCVAGWSFLGDAVALVLACAEVCGSLLLAYFPSGVDLGSH
jgi:hypothetical protein